MDEADSSTMARDQEPGGRVRWCTKPCDLARVVDPSAGLGVAVEGGRGVVPRPAAPRFSPTTATLRYVARSSFWTLRSAPRMAGLGTRWRCCADTIGRVQQH